MQFGLNSVNEKIRNDHLNEPNSYYSNTVYLSHIMHIFQWFPRSLCLFTLMIYEYHAPGLKSTKAQLSMIDKLNDWSLVTLTEEH